MAGVEHAAGPGGHGGVDRGGVRRHRHRAGDRGRHDEDLLGSVERVRERGRVGEVRGVHADAAACERGGLGRVSDADPHRLGRDPLQESLDDA
ncbi:hypothetical protein GCM10023175_22340 [Pseudonocardia xishanensis]|uniref:Uncharacterized protein n=1 Tax=Pseudonocardia xishanensis TaxID=630995 RepID=A0ABP8RQ25_9PSEU